MEKPKNSSLNPVDQASPRQDRGTGTPFLKAVAQSVIAGLILALTFFLWREVMFPVPTVGGPWHCLTQTTSGRYQGLHVGWRLVLAQSDRALVGSIEKIWDNRGRLSGKAIHPGSGAGFLQYNYITTSRFSLNLDLRPRDGTRPSTIFIDLPTSRNLMRGTFYWTAADSIGVIACQREPINLEDEKIRAWLLPQ